MKKNIFTLSLGIMTVLMASCGGNPVLDGYDFQGDGILGKIPVGQAVQVGTAKELHDDLMEEIGDIKLSDLTVKEAKRMEELDKKMEDKFNHCLDDMKDDLAADSARLKAMQDINWENKTSCKVKLGKVDLDTDFFKSVFLFFDVNDDELKTLPAGELYYAFLDKKGKAVESGRVKDKNVIIQTKSVVMSGPDMLSEVAKEERYKELMNYCLKLDSLYHLVILDGDQILDYQPSLTPEGVGPLKIGADMHKFPKSLDGIYEQVEETMYPDGTYYLSFNSVKGIPYFMGMGDINGKLESIEISSEKSPVKIGNIILRVGTPYGKVVEKYGKKISWSYNPDTFSARASFAGGKVYFEVFSDFFSESGAAKLQQLQNGAKNLSFAPSDFNPEEKVQYLFIEQGK